MIKIVPKEDMEVLKRYLTGKPTVVLIDEALMDTLQPPIAEALRDMDAGTWEMEYDHGGEADVMVDMVSSSNHYFIGCVEFALEQEGKNNDSEDQ